MAATTQTTFERNGIQVREEVVQLDRNTVRVTWFAGNLRWNGVGKTAEEARVKIEAKAAPVLQ